MDGQSATPDPSRFRVWRLTGLMAVTAGAVAATGFVDDPLAALPTPAWWALLPVFALTEVVVIHLPARRSSHSHTLRELPAVAGLTFLAPQQYVLVYLIGCTLALLVWSRQRGMKLAFNAALLALEASLGVAAYHFVLQGGDPLSVRAWAAATAAVLLTDLVSAAAITAVIRITDGGIDTQVLRQALFSGFPAAVVNTAVALLVVVLAVDRPSALPLLGVVVVLLVLGYRIYVSLARRYAQMDLLYRFVGSTGRGAELADVLPEVLGESARLLRARGARLVMLDDDRRPTGGWTWRDDQLEREPPEAAGAAVTSAWWWAAAEGEPVLLRHEDQRQRVDPEAPRDGIAVPLLGGGLVEGVLMVVERSFEEETFGHDDVRVFETLAAHASVALDKARAVDRLHRLAQDREHEALHDPLTGLPNRRALTAVVAELLGNDERGSVLLICLDHFADINDTLGPAVGDGLLVQTGRRLEQLGLGIVARVGSHEFAVMLRGVGPAAALEQAEAASRELGEPVRVDDIDICTGISVGVADLLGGRGTSEDVLGRAEVAMHAASSAGTMVELYRPEDGVATARRLALAVDLPRAVRDGEVELYFQPQAQPGSGRVTGFEALLRWRHPTLGMVPPPEVVAVAQRTGLMQTLTGYLLEKALRARADWQRAGHDLDVSVNVTPRDVADIRLLELVDAALTATGTPPGALVLEITESDALGNPEHSLAVMAALVARGIRLSVDDFGTGYSSLAYLDQLPVHELKIDQCFVFRLEKEATDATIVRATVALAHDLGLRVVAEGVESDLVRSLIADLGCDLFQGYGLARPMPECDVLGWLDRRAAYRPHAPRPYVAVR